MQRARIEWVFAATNITTEDLDWLGPALSLISVLVGV